MQRIWKYTILIIVFSTSACSYEVCDPQGAVFTALQENHEEWLAYFDENPSDFPMHNGLRFEVNDSPYVVYYYEPVDGLLVSTNHGLGPSATPEGISGYYYSPNGQPRPEMFRYVDLYMDSNIFCYRKPRVQGVTLNQVE